MCRHISMLIWSDPYNLSFSSCFPEGATIYICCDEIKPFCYYTRTDPQFSLDNSTRPKLYVTVNVP